MLIARPWSRTYTNSVGTVAPTNGTVNDSVVDSRSALVKTRKDVNGWRPPTDYSRTVTSLNTVAADFSCWINGKAGVYAGGYTWNETYSGAALHGASDLPAFSQRLADSAIIKARLALKDERVNLSENFATRKMTAELVATTCGRLAEAVRATRKMDARGLQRALGLRRKQVLSRKPFDLWLEHRYGWQPLLGDVHSSITSISDSYQNGSRGVVTVKGSAHDEDTTEAVFYVQGQEHVNWRFRKYGRRKVSCLVRLDYTEGNGLGSTAFRSAQELGLTNPFELAWELLPFSFVADWFIPVGDFLSQLDADLGYVFKGGSISHKETSNYSIAYDGLTYTGQGSTPQYFNGGGYCSGAGKSRQMSMTRTTYGTSPLPNLPDLSKFRKSSGVHAANGIALLTSAFVGWQDRVTRRKK